MYGDKWPWKVGVFKQFLCMLQWSDIWLWSVKALVFIRMCLMAVNMVSVWCGTIWSMWWSAFSVWAVTSVTRHSTGTSQLFPSSGWLISSWEICRVSSFQSVRATQKSLAMRASTSIWTKFLIYLVRASIWRIAVLAAAQPWNKLTSLPGWKSSEFTESWQLFVLLSFIMLHIYGTMHFPRLFSLCWYQMSTDWLSRPLWNFGVGHC